MAYSNPQLKSKFRAFNKKYFGNKLSDKTVVIYQKTFSVIKGRRKSDFGECTMPEGKNPGVIKINPILAKKKWRSVIDMTLLHEMVHLKGVDNHGTDFETEMTRLAMVGAFKNRW